MASTNRKNTNKKVATELPFNADAEKVVLGSAMLKKDYCLEILNSLEEEDFFLGKHQLMFRAIASLAVRGIEIGRASCRERVCNDV